MPKFKVTVEYGLTTEIEPELSGHEMDPSDPEVENFEEDSYWRGETVRVEGGQVRFEIEAADEDDATEKALNVILDGSEVEDRNGLTWLVEDVNVTEVEPVVPEMTVDVAKDILRRWLSGMGDNEVPAEVKLAIFFLLERIS